MEGGVKNTWNRLTGNLWGISQILLVRDVRHSSCGVMKTKERGWSCWHVRILPYICQTSHDLPVLQDMNKTKLLSVETKPHPCSRQFSVVGSITVMSPASPSWRVSAGTGISLPHLQGPSNPARAAASATWHWHYQPPPPPTAAGYFSANSGCAFCHGKASLGSLAQSVLRMQTTVASARDVTGRCETLQAAPALCPGSLWQAVAGREHKYHQQSCVAKHWFCPGQTPQITAKETIRHCLSNMRKQAKQNVQCSNWVPEMSVYYWNLKMYLPQKILWINKKNMCYTASTKQPRRVWYRISNLQKT